MSPNQLKPQHNDKYPSPSTDLECLPLESSLIPLSSAVKKIKIKKDPRLVTTIMRLRKTSYVLVNSEISITPNSTAAQIKAVRLEVSYLQEDFKSVMDVV